ncbi:serine hydrolase [Hanstruepera marina]|uniref:serine hydrolase n=1 Tax=Hanstruepera marina TaxID=2873265 RepID=UPI001CA7AA9A|nr:serine hydrolase [Hanstruepera marina]
MKRLAILLITLHLFVIGSSCSQEANSTTPTNDKAHKIDSLISLYADYEGFNGSVLVAHEGEVILKKGYGSANKEWDIPNTVDTKFQIASVTKPFTAFLILQLASEGKIDLHEPITTYLPSYPNKIGDSITVQHLLTHSSGLSRSFISTQKGNNPKVMMEDIAAMPLEFAPGETFKYSNSGYNLLGYLIETLTGMAYEDALQDRIFNPLGMKNSGLFNNRAIIKHMASGYYKGFGDYFNIERNYNLLAYASGGIYSTVEDLFIFNQALNNDEILSKTYRDLMQKKHIEDPGYSGYYGYGLEIMEKPIGNSGKMIETYGHSGAIDGFCALFTTIPSSNSTIIFLNNTRRAFLNSMTTAITGALYDETYDFPKIPLAKFMSQTIDKDGIDAGISYYKTHQDHPDYYISEQELIVAGYKYLQAGNAQYAADIFKLSIDVFPDKDNPYDSYAEALMVLGRNDDAIKNYKKSLELNPNNHNAKAMLKKLQNK